MDRSKRIFLFFTLVFLGIMFFVSYDIARRTTFPGAKAQLKYRLEEKFAADSVKADTNRTRQPERKEKK